MITTRFAPSPTGAAHAGGYRTAMYAWLYARKNRGRFVLRIEDTDSAREVPGSREDIFEALAWLGIDIDETYIQSDHLARHREVLEQLIESGAAYVSAEPAKDGSGIIKEIVRFKNPNKVVTVHDLIRGDVSMDTTDLGDFVIARSVTDPLYHLAVVIDDYDEGVTHVIRAEEHLSNTPRHILIYEALGWDLPVYAHLPLVFGTDKTKLSKRRGALAMTEYKKQGYLPEAVFNAVALCGWNPGEGSEQEIFSQSDLIQSFSLERVQKSAAVFNSEKLDWFNREYIKLLTTEQQADAVRPYVMQLPGFDESVFQKCLPLIIERVTKWSDVQNMVDAGELQYYFADPTVSTELLTAKGTSIELVKTHLSAIASLLQDYTGEWDAESIKQLLMPYAEIHGRGAVLWPLRCALSGRDKSPDPFTLMFVLGKRKSMMRLSIVLSLANQSIQT